MGNLVRSFQTLAKENLKGDAVMLGKHNAQKHDRWGDRNWEGLWCAYQIPSSVHKPVKTHVQDGPDSAARKVGR